MTDKEILTEINEWLFWDYHNHRWKPGDEDPNWNGLDLVCAIAELLEKNGYGPDE
jgi:hypothetical protein